MNDDLAISDVTTSQPLLCDADSTVPEAWATSDRPIGTSLSDT